MWDEKEYELGAWGGEEGEGGWGLNKVLYGDALPWGPDPYTL